MLHLLEKLHTHLHSYKNCLAGWHCIYVQHLLRSNIDCTEFLFSMGLSRDNIVIIGKGYSSNSQVMTHYLESGIRVLDVIQGYSYTEAFDIQICRQIKKIVSFFNEIGCKKLLLIDEGGLGIQALSSLNHKSFERIAITELTARGVHQYHLLSNLYPIVDVARSKNKKEIESKIIAHSMVSNLIQILKSISRTDLVKLRFGLIGAGAIGSSIIEELRRHGLNIVSWYDEDTEKSNIDNIKELARRVDVVLSSTGKGVDWEPVVSEADGTIIFANCGSSDIEYKLWKLRAKLIGQGYEFITDNSGYPWRGNTILRRGTTECIYLRGGFPVNFDGSADPISSDIIQITRATLMAGAITAVMCKTTGVIGLPEELQKQLVKEYSSLNKL